MNEEYTHFEDEQPLEGNVFRTLVITAVLFMSIVVGYYLFYAAPNTFSHDVDNLSKHLNAFLNIGNNETKYRVDPTKQHHCADGLCEGQFTNSCFTNPQTDSTTGRTFHQISKNFWHWRRQLIAQIQILAGRGMSFFGFDVAKGRIKAGYQGIPFVNYDPLYLGHDPRFPEAYAEFVKDGFPGNSGLEIRFDLFSIPHHSPQIIKGVDLKPIGLKRCGDLTPMELNHAPECLNTDPNLVVMFGGDSYKAPEPFRNEDAFVYYDRIPAHPIADACIGWLEKRWGFEFALTYAKAHEVAGKNHVYEVWIRTKYLNYVRKYV